MANYYRITDALRKHTRKREKGEGKFTLSSGIKSKYFVDVTAAISEAEVLRDVCEVVADHVRQEECTAVGGPASGADPIVAVVAALTNTRWFSVRADARINGYRPTKDDKVLLVDDVTTTGTSLLHAYRAVKDFDDENIEIAKLVTLVERSDEPMLLFYALGIKYHAVVNYELLEIPRIVVGPFDDYKDILKTERSGYNRKV